MAETSTAAPAKKILVIEDEVPIQRILETMLRRRGYQVETAQDGVEGLRKTFQTTPDLVLTDVVMPKLTGLEYLGKIRPHIPAEKLPIIIVSALGREDQIMEGFRSGATDYVIKPFKGTELLAKVQVALRETVDPGNVSLDRHAFEELLEAPAQPLEQGGFLDMGKYRLLEEAGSGGMGTVYRARHLGYGVDVALKVLDPELARDKTYALRFLREVRIASQLSHPNIVKVFDIGLNGDHIFYAMEFLAEPSLSALLGKCGAFEESHIVEIGAQVASALEYMHGRHFLHRDVKPDNLILGSDGLVRLIDFGLATALDDKRLTKEGSFLGTPGYVAPESVREYRAPDTGSDIYSLGATLYALATGSPPFDEYTEPMGKLLAQTRVNLEPACQINPKISRELSSVIGRMTARKQKLRYATMSQARKALEDLL